MRYLNPLDDLLNSRTRLRILRFLASQHGERSGREIARAIGMGETPTSRALRSLADTLLVLYRSDGRSHWFRMNRRHALAQEVLLPLFHAESRQLARAVRSLLEGLRPHVQCAVVFGSAARGDESWSSDLDLLVIVPSEQLVEPVRQTLKERDLQFLLRYGVASPQVLSTEDATFRLANGEAWLEEALATGQVMCGALPACLCKESAA